jgi:tetratricopeptide (TPR) repeat protein
MNAPSRLKPALLAVAVATGLATAGGAQAADPVATVGTVTETNGLERNGRFVVRTPSILRPGVDREVPPNVLAAIAQYDRILEIPTTAANRAEALRRGADLRVQLADVDGEVNLPVLRRAIAMYQALLREAPDHPLNDRALYQLARAQQAVGEIDAAIGSLQALGQRHPYSFRTPDGVFRAGELLFQRHRYAEAEQAYGQVLAQGPTTPYFEPAQYKSGWSMVRQGRHAEALTPFFAILDRELPPGTLEDPDAAIAALRPAAAEQVREVLKVTGRSLAALGGGRSLNARFEQGAPEPRYATLLYAALAQQLVEQRRYTEAADVGQAFVERHPQHPRAAQFEQRAIAAYREGGFDELLLAAEARHVERYAPGSAYWSGRPPDPAVLAVVREHLTDLAGHHHARAQARPEAETAARTADFALAAGWYARTLALFPDDPQAAGLALLQADALYDGGQVEAAARQYERAAYELPGSAGSSQSPATALAAVQAWQRLARDGDAEARSAALKQSVRASLRLAEAFPKHPQWSQTLTRAAGDLLATGDADGAFAVASRVLAARPPAAAEQRRAMLGVVADARYSQKHYAAAEAAYGDLLKLLAAGDPLMPQVAERLARSVYEQAVAAREAGDLNAAALAFQRVGTVVPDATIRAAADYDAAAAWVQLKDWPNAARSLEAFRSRHPAHARVGDAERQLALVYTEDRKPARSAVVYAQLAQRVTLSPELRRDALWLSANDYRRAGDGRAAAEQFERYANTWPQPLDQAQEARRSLAELAKPRDRARYLYWLQAIVDADGPALAKGADTPARRIAAQASLELGQAAAARAGLLALNLPLEASLAQRRIAIEAALRQLDRAALYGYAEVTTAATHERASIWRDFGRAIVRSARPDGLSDEALEQYQLLLEEQANAFDEKAMQAYEANLAYLRQGVWNDWVRKSSLALSELAPARYGKNVRLEDRYEAIH